MTAQMESTVSEPRLSRDVVAARVRSALTPAILTVLVVVVALPVAGVSLSLHQTVMVALINIVMTVGLYVFVGNSGVWSFGHIGFALIGAYAAALATIPVAMKTKLLPDAPGFIVNSELSGPMAIVLGAVVAGIFAAVVGIPLSRVGGLTAGLATMSMLIALNSVASQWDAVTRGTKGLIGIPQRITMGGALACVAIVIVAAWMFQRSRRGMLLRASKSDDVAATALGISVARERWVSLVASAMIVGAGGAMFALQLGSINPSVFYIDYTFLVIAMLVIGGADSLTGAVVGSLVTSVIAEVLRQVESGSLFGVFTFPSHAGIANVGLGIVLVVVLIRFPRGLTGGREFSASFAFRQGRDVLADIAKRRTQAEVPQKGEENE